MNRAAGLPKVVLVECRLLLGRDVAAVAVEDVRRVRQQDVGEDEFRAFRLLEVLHVSGEDRARKSGSRRVGQPQRIILAVRADDRRGLLPRIPAAF